ncbi:hypothetical protein BHE74_00004275 [Ensete ventricosum]|nr:hypothetical protein BHE74_00004275 [Ensete ventricosum]
MQLPFLFSMRALNPSNVASISVCCYDAGGQKAMTVMRLLMEEARAFPVKVQKMVAVGEEDTVGHNEKGLKMARLKERQGRSSGQCHLLWIAERWSRGWAATAVAMTVGAALGMKGGGWVAAAIEEGRRQRRQSDAAGSGCSTGGDGR